MYEGKIFQAIQLASHKHKDQKRKITEYPYITHPLMVYHMVTIYSDDQNAHIAALLHDVVEDTDTSLDYISQEYGDVVAEYVRYLSDNKELPWLERQITYQKQLIDAPHDVLLIKVADLFYNIQDSIHVLEEYGLDAFHELYKHKEWLEVKKNLIQSLKKSWVQNPLISEVEKVMAELEEKYKE